MWMGYSSNSHCQRYLCKPSRVRILPYPSDPPAIKAFLELSAKKDHKIICDIIKFQTICFLAGMESIFHIPIYIHFPWYIHRGILILLYHSCSTLSSKTEHVNKTRVFSGALITVLASGFKQRMICFQLKQFN